MTDILQISNEIFGNLCLILFEETLYYFRIRYQIAAPGLPSAEKLRFLCSKCLERDDIEIKFYSVENFCFSNNNGLTQEHAYGEYQSQLEQNDTVKVAIDIQKKFVDEIISVYNIESFSEFLCSQKMEESFQLFAELFNGGRQHICFQVLNRGGCIHTSSIAFAAGAFCWDRAISRDNFIRNCNDTSVFLGRGQYPLVPQDFTIIDQVYDNCLNSIKGLFDRLRNILSYLYIANTSNIVGNKAVLQFDPAVNGYEYSLEQLSGNYQVWNIYSWIHKDDSCIDRASIARNIINIHCKSADAILNIDENIYKSAVANYVIYQKKHADQYIELKNKLSEFIVGSAGQLQELAHDLVEGFRNNFVAVIVFLMTVLLTDSIDFSNFTKANVSANIVSVCGIFTYASLLYMIVTIFARKIKWGWLERAYDDLKKNYSGVLDEQDIAVAVNNDSAFKNTKKEYKKVRLMIGSIWIAAIIGMLVFTLVIGQHHQNNEPFPANTSNAQVTDESETEMPKTGMASNTDRNCTDLSLNAEKRTQENSA